MQSNFATAFSVVKQQFMKVIETMDSVNLFGNFSILEFFIALLVLGSILPIFIITIANWSSDGLSASYRAEDRVRRERLTEEYRKNRELATAAHRSAMQRIYRDSLNKK